MKIFDKNVSKKATGAMAGLAVVLGDGWANMGLSDNQMICIAVIVAGYAIGQGIADSGKEKAKVEKGVA